MTWYTGKMQRSTNFKTPRSPFITKKVYTDLCLFLFCFKNLMLIIKNKKNKNLMLTKLGLSQTCTVNFQKADFKALKQKVDGIYGT